MSMIEGGDAPKKRAKPGPKTGAEQVASGQITNTKYKPEYCKKVIEWGKKGKSPVWMASKLNIAKATILHWAEVHPQFSNALTLARAHAQAWWEDAGQRGMTRVGFQGNVWARNVASRFREDWAEVKTQVNEDGPERAKSNAEEQKRARELIERLGLALGPDGTRGGTPPTGAAEFPIFRDDH